MHYNDHLTFQLTHDRIENFIYTMVKFGLSSCSMMVYFHANMTIFSLLSINFMCTIGLCERCELHAVVRAIWLSML